MAEHFFVKLIPHRATFAQDMTADEREIMMRHAGYWRELMNRQIVLVFGPVMDPAGLFGMGVIEADDEPTVMSLLDKDPAIVLNHYEIYPMRAVHPGQLK